MAKTQSTKFDMTPQFAKLGFTRTTPGHKIVKIEGDASRNYGGRQYFEAFCKCGFTSTGYVTKAGRASGWSTRYWNEHVDGMASPDEIYSVGVITKQRVRWDVFVISRNYSGRDDYSAGGWYGAHSEHDWYKFSHWACVIHKSPSGERVISRVARTKDQAVDQGRKLLQQAEREGHTVEWGSDAEPDAPAISPKASLVAFVERVDDAMTAKLGEAKETLDLLDEFMVSVPILQSKREALADHVLDLMSLGMDLSDGEAEENETQVQPDAESGVHGIPVPAADP